ncbi:MAG: ABC transporter ATP-binding protein [Acidimicrobiia bacterium]|nr:ABC transporter ATP-binding protein [Acidimicrobiia bacterium]MDH5502719.1 ABC transporter ATP-binding protein [Acidimicrobiia bacterium]
MTLFSVDNLTHNYGEIQALTDVTLAVPDGAIGLVGANGAGKSTLIKILLGLLTPTSGEVEVLGENVRTHVREARARVGYMPEGDCLPVDQSASDFVAYAAELAGVPAKAARRRASESLALVGLGEERFRYLKDFSTGMFQRVKLAQAIVHDPRVVFLDEPTAGLDPEGREQMLELVNRLSDYNISVIFSTHILSDIERTCDWVVLLDNGRVKRNSPLDRLGSHGVVQLELIDDPQSTAEILRSRGLTVTVNGFRMSIPSADGVTTMIRDAFAETGTGIRSMTETQVTLEEAFFAVGPDFPPPVPT